MIQHNLALAFSDRVRGEKADNLECAIDIYQLVLQIYTRDAFPEQWATTQNNLGDAYRIRVCGQRAENLECAFRIYELILQVYTWESFPERWAMTQNNLALVCCERIFGKRSENIEQAINRYELALRVYTHESFPEQWAMTQNNLALTYVNRIDGRRVENLERAITKYQLALQVYTPQSFPKECCLTARNLGDLYFVQQAWTEAARTYTIALESVEVLYQAAFLVDGKSSELAEISDLPRRAAYALARSGKLQAATLILEQYRARGLSEILGRDRNDLTQLQQTNLPLYIQYQQITTQIHNLETQQRLWMVSEERHGLTPEVFRTEALRLRQSLRETIEQIHQVKGYEHFLVKLDFNDIQQAVRPNIPLVYLAPTSGGSIALIVTQDDITPIWLDKVIEAELDDIVNKTWFNAFGQLQTNLQSWLETIEQVTHQLWRLLMAPLIDQLKQSSFEKATLIPTAYLSLLPLHASWTEDSTTTTGKRYALDEIHFTYAPNAQSFNVSANVACQIEADSILAIDNPLKDLPNSSREVNAALANFPQHKVLKHEEATINSVLAALTHCNILHFSCHGTANLREPLNSGLAMSDGLLTLRNILDLKLSDRGGIRLAVLSACETGLTGTELVDEAIGLPTGLLQAGVAGVVASLWSVSDLSTMILLSRFYDLWRKDRLEPALALHQAQLWMRDTTSQQKAKYFESNNPEVFQSLVLLPSNYFAHPFHWAAFSYVGV